MGVLSEPPEGQNGNSTQNETSFEIEKRKACV
jgi:hypothetical protein